MLSRVSALLLVAGASTCSAFRAAVMHQRPVVIPRARPVVAADLFVADPSYNLAAGAAVIGTIFGGLEDIKGGDGEKLPTAKVFGGGAVLFIIIAAFFAFQSA